MTAQPTRPERVRLFCSGCGESFEGSPGLAGALCGRGRVEISTGPEPQRCPYHGAPLFPIPELGQGGLSCRHCLEPSCDLCFEPWTLCVCEKETF